LLILFLYPSKESIPCQCGTRLIHSKLRRRCQRNWDTLIERFKSQPHATQQSRMTRQEHQHQASTPKWSWSSNRQNVALGGYSHGAGGSIVVGASAAPPSTAHTTATAEQTPSAAAVQAVPSQPQVSLSLAPGGAAKRSPALQQVRLPQGYKASFPRQTTCLTRHSVATPQTNEAAPRSTRTLVERGIKNVSGRRANQRQR